MTLSPYRAIFRRDALTAWSYRLDFLLQVGSALFGTALWFFFSKFAAPAPGKVPGGDYFSYLVLGMVLMGYINVVLHTFAAKVRQEKVAGTLEMLLSSPAPAYGLLLASALWDILLQTLHAALFVGAAWFFGARFHGGSILGLAAASLLFAASMAAFGIMAASLLMVFQKGEPVTPFVGALFALMGSVFFPASILPEPLRAAAQLLPLTHALEAVRGVLLEGKGFTAVAPQIGILAAFCAVLLPASYGVFALCLRSARRYGLLAQY